jgi:hypothetical protein
VFLGSGSHGVRYMTIFPAVLFRKIKVGSQTVGYRICSPFLVGLPRPDTCSVII